MKRSGIAGRRVAALAEGSASYKARRSEIIEAAALVFKERGYDQSTLNDVAEKLQTDRASLYYYFGSKEEILQEIVRAVLEENVATAERVASQSGSPREKLVLLIDEMTASFDRNYPQMYVYIEDLARIGRQDGAWAKTVLASTRRFEEVVLTVLDEGMADGSIRADLPGELAALALFGMINWTHRWYRPGGSHTPEELARTFSNIFLDGSCVREPAQP